MSGQDIPIEQFWEELEKAHAASEYQTRRIEHYRTQLDFCERRAEKAERERDEGAEREREERLEALGRASSKPRGSSKTRRHRAVRGRDHLGGRLPRRRPSDRAHHGRQRRHALLADVSEAVANREETAGVDVRSDEIKELRKRAEKAERERDEDAPNATRGRTSGRGCAA